MALSMLSGLGGLANPKSTWAFSDARASSVFWSFVLALEKIFFSLWKWD